ncbi:MAG: SpoIIE family protein phosphatase [Candidatus Rifleibacteriota bacterium]
MGYLHVEINTAQSSKKKNAVCGDAFTFVRKPEATYILLSDGIGSGIKANVYAGMTINRLKTLIESGLSLRGAFAGLVKTMHTARGTDLPYAVFSVIQILKNGETTILAYEMPEGIFVGHRSATPLRKRDYALGSEVISETNLFLDPGEGIIVYSDGISQAGIGLTTRTGWSAKEICSFLNNHLFDSADMGATMIHDRARELWQGHRGDDCTVISAFCRTGIVLNIFTGPPADRSIDGRIVREFCSGEGLKVVSGATTARVVANGLSQKLKINQDDHSLISPPGYHIDGIDLVTEGAVTLNQVYNILDVDPVKFEPDSSVSRLCEMIRSADRINFLVGNAENEAHEDISFRQRGIIPRKKIVRILAERLEQIGKLVKITSF